MFSTGLPATRARFREDRGFGNPRAAPRVDLPADDGLHPSAAQYTLWAEAALSVVRDMLAAAPAA